MIPAVQHVPREGMGLIEQSLAARGLSWRYLMPYAGQPVKAGLGGIDGLVLMVDRYAGDLAEAGTTADGVLGPCAMHLREVREVGRRVLDRWVRLAAGDDGKETNGG